MAVKLQRLKDLNTAITPMGGAYNPPKNEIKAATLTAQETLLDGLEGQINPLETLLNDKQEERYSKTHNKLEVNGSDGIIRQSRRVAGLVEEMGEEHQDKAEMIRRAVNKISPSKTRRKPSGPEDKTRSTSEQAFDSLFKQAQKIADIIVGMPAYLPADGTISSAAYMTNVTDLKLLSKDIGSIEKDLVPLQKQRSREYKNLEKVINSSKKYIKNSFGATSPQYDSVKNI